MKDAADYANAFSSAKIDAGQLKAFSETLAGFEVNSGFKPKKILVNGIPGFPDTLGATFEVPKDSLSGIIDQLLAHPTLPTNILVNGIPANPFRQITVLLTR
jgi:hypothetical protein